MAPQRAGLGAPHPRLTDDLPRTTLPRTPVNTGLDRRSVPLAASQPAPGPYQPLRLVDDGQQLFHGGISRPPAPPPHAHLLPHPVAGLPLVHAGTGLTAPGGVAVPGSSAPPSSSCLWSLRERCFGPAHMTTATATAHHTAASSHDCLTESAPEKASGESAGMTVPPEMVLNMACIIMTISTLPPVP